MNRLATIFTATVLSLALLLMIGTGTASAHAKVISATPGIGSTVATAPTTVTVEAVENVNPDPKVSNLFVYSPAGELISQGNATVPLNNPKQMSIAIKPTGNGVYIVRWITVSADDKEADEGAFTFTVKPATTGTTANSTTTPGNKTTTAAPPTTSESSPVVPSVVTGIIALLVGLATGFGIARARAGANAIGSAGASTPETTNTSS